MRLLVKFNLILLVVFGACSLVISYFAHSFLIGNAREQVSAQAQLMLANAASVRDYISEDVAPIIEQNPHHRVRFLPEAVPFFGATETFDNLRKAYPDYTYKEAALNPTNPEDRASDWEADIIQYLRDHPGETHASGTRPTPYGEALYLAHPIRATRECLQCHSSPEAAPAGLVAVYGTDNGFGWKLNEIVGAQIVSVPMSVPVQIADRAYQRLMLFLAVTLILTICAIDAGVYWFVMRPLRVVSATADRVSRGEKDVPPLRMQGRDEIAVVARAVSRMQVSLAKALRIIDEG